MLVTIFSNCWCVDAWLCCWCAESRDENDGDRAPHSPHGQRPPTSGLGVRGWRDEILDCPALASNQDIIETGTPPPTLLTRPPSPSLPGSWWSWDAGQYNNGGRQCWQSLLLPAIWLIHKTEEEDWRTNWLPPRSLSILYYTIVGMMADHCLTITNIIR